MFSLLSFLCSHRLFYYPLSKNGVAEREQNNLTAIVSQLPQQKAYIAQKQLENQDNAYMLFQLTDELDSIAKNASNDAIAAMALIKSAEVLRTELHFRFGAISQQDITTQIGKAKDYYTKALDKLKRSPNPTLEAVAKIGLGLCEEELGNADAARKLYQEVATGAAYEGTAPVEAAKQRLIAMDSFTEKIVLKPMPRTNDTGAAAGSRRAKRTGPELIIARNAEQRYEPHTSRRPCPPGTPAR